VFVKPPPRARRLRSIWGKEKLIGTGVASAAVLGVGVGEICVSPPEEELDPPPAPPPQPTKNTKKKDHTPDARTRPPNVSWTYML
jgi:hypothetical protein